MGTLVVALGRELFLVTPFNPSRPRLIVGAGEVWRWVGTLVVALCWPIRLVVARWWVIQLLVALCWPIRLVVTLGEIILIILIFSA